MNREQRRAQQRKGKVVMVNLNDVTFPWQMDDSLCAVAMEDRVAANKRETGHPLHHKTANGAIVTPDPTLEYYLNRLREHPEYKETVQLIHLLAVESDKRTDIPKAIPVYRKFYGHDIYERH
jgi:hypothetical protein